MRRNLQCVANLNSNLMSKIKTMNFLIILETSFEEIIAEGTQTRGNPSDAATFPDHGVSSIH
jgi:hypothetical protein